MDERETDSMGFRGSPRHLLAVLVVGGLVLIAKGGNDWHKLSGIPDWDKAFGKIIESKPHPPRGAQIIYQYRSPTYKNLQINSCSIMPNQKSVKINPKLYFRGNRLKQCKNRYIDLSSMNEADALLAKFPKDKGVEIYVGKKGSYLVAEPFEETWYYWMLGGVLLALVGLVLLKLIPPLPRAGEKVDLGPRQAGDPSSGTPPRG